jgi:hypothetical protein
MADRDLKDRVRDWLAKGGYPLEMRVADAFGKRRFRVMQSEYYTDVNTGVSREIDVFASVQQDLGPSFIRLSALVECKSDTTKPWVVFTSSRVRLADRARVVQRSATRLGDEWLDRISTRSDVTNLKIFRLPARPGYGVAAAFSEKLDTPYAALTAVAGAANAVAAEADTRSDVLAATFSRGKAVLLPRAFTLVQFPVVVTEAPLFECYLNTEQGMEIEEIKQTVVVWRNPIYQKPHCIIHLIHSSKVEEFVSEIESDFRYLLKEALQTDGPLKAK